MRPIGDDNVNCTGMMQNGEILHSTNYTLAAKTDVNSATQPQSHVENSATKFLQAAH